MASTAGGRWPSLVVFDLDDCVWSPEMYTLSAVPSAADAVRGDLGNGKAGVVGVRSGGEVIRLFPGALQAFQRVLAGEYGVGMRLAAASSADTPQAVRIGRAALAVLEVLPGVTLLEAFDRAGGGFEGTPGGVGGNLQIGRTAPLTSDKSKTHFPILRANTGVAYEEMLFFDDCNWTDHCTAVERALGVVAQRTPHGMQVEEWEAGLQKWRSARGASFSS
jgi:magnesium-dependent phosphatase 1